MNQNKTVHAGDSLYLGSYPQRLNGDIFPIEWKVLAAEEDRVLVLSRYVLERQPFHEQDGVIRWEDCSLRRWLNEVFMRVAFTEEEMGAICSPEPAEDPSGEFLWQAFGLETATSGIGDRIFLLSSDDICRYYPAQNGNNLFCPGASAQSTECAGYEKGEEVCWWLRSSMSSFPMANIVSPVDSVGMSLIDGDNTNGVRPAMWLHADACPGLKEPIFKGYSPLDEDERDYEWVEEDFLRKEAQDRKNKAGAPARKVRPRAKEIEAPEEETNC